MRFLIDECLTPKLAKLAQARGHEAAHVVWLGMGGTKDWDLMPVIVAGDWTFVTRNAVDFRGRADAPGEPGLHARAAIHAGLVCLNGDSMDLDDQEEMFEVALVLLDEDPDFVNQALEITNDGTDQFAVRRYTLPA